VHTDEAEMPGSHVVHELGLGLDRVGELIHGSAEIVHEVCAPDTPYVRTSVLAAWTDWVSGLLTVGVIAPRLPVTLQLDVHVLQQRTCKRVELVAQPIKTGRSVVVTRVDFTDESGNRLAIGTASFMAAPDPSVVLPPEAVALASTNQRQPGRRLAVPFAQRARCERPQPGVAVLPRSDDGLNSSKTVHGGLIALVVEEAALSTGQGGTLSSMTLRYLRPVRSGPAVATADIADGVGTVEVRDAGDGDRLAAFATTTLARRN
jgi:acyl-coenzyme A thioesterase PaaI-like protein